MKSRWILGLAALGLIGGAPAAGDGPAITHLPSPDSPLVAVRVVFRAGSQDDPPGKEGLAALTAAMIAEGGTEELTYEQVLEKFYPMAATLAGSCRKEVTVFSGTIHRDNLATFGDLVASMIVRPRFAPDDFERLRSEAVDAIARTLRGGNDEELGKWTLQLALYPGHPYGHVDRGTVQGLKAITLDDVKAFHRAHYARSNLQVGLAGGAGAGPLDRIKAAFAPLPAGAAAPPPLPAVARPTGLEITIVDKPAAEATAVSLGFPIDLNRRDDDFYALAVANSYLGEHRTFNGKLMQDLRGKRGLNYGDYSYIEDFIQEGGGTFPVANNPRRQQYFSIWIRPVPRDKAVFALRAALWEFDRLVDSGMSPADFEATRSFLLNYSKLWVQTASRRLGHAMDGAFHGRDDEVTELARRLPSLTVDQVNAAVRRHLKTGGFRVAIVARDALGLKDALLAAAPTPLTYDTQGTPADVLAEDKVIAAYPIRASRVAIVPVGSLFEK